MKTLCQATVPLLCGEKQWLYSSIMKYVQQRTIPSWNQKDDCWFHHFFLSIDCFSRSALSHPTLKIPDSAHDPSDKATDRPGCFHTSVTHLIQCVFYSSDVVVMQWESDGAYASTTWTGIVTSQLYHFSPEITTVLNFVFSPFSISSHLPKHAWIGLAGLNWR